MCPHTTVYNHRVTYCIDGKPLVCLCLDTTVYVSSSYYYECVRILLYITTESPTVLMASRWTFHTATSKRETSRSDHPTRWWLQRLCMQQGRTPSADSPSTSVGPFVTSSSSKRPFGSLSPTLLSNKINQTVFALVKDSAKEKCSTQLNCVDQDQD